MSIVSARGVAKSYGAVTVLGDVSLTIAPGERVGLVGANGSGKSTLARIVCAAEPPDRGDVERRRGARIAYLAQEPALDPALGAREIALSALPAWGAARAEVDSLAERLAERPDDGELLEQHARAVAELERAGGWDVAHRVDAVLERLGVDDRERPVGSFSGGERRRVALASVLVSAPDLAVLDEPTNHLDADTVEWLERFLVQDYAGALLLVTHDRYLLDRVVQRTVEIAGGRAFSYDGGWQEYLAAKAEREAAEARTEANRQNSSRRELEWLRRQPKARTGKQKARIARAETALGQRGPSAKGELRLDLEQSRVGGRILELDAVGIDQGECVLIDSLTLLVEKGDRIGIVGPNGTGKSTLLRCILGEREPERGVIRVGKKTRIAYFDQNRAGLDDEQSVLRNVAGDGDTVEFAGTTMGVHPYLDRFLFPGDKRHQKVGTLSGGERARVALAKLLLGSANVIVLDEPTNDLDVMALSALEELLTSVSGACLVVTHDRYLLDRVATSTLVFEGDGRVERYPGGYSDAKRLRAERAATEKAEREARAPEAAPKKERAAEPKRKLSYKERRELDGMMDRIAEQEARVGELEAVLADPSTYAERGAEVPELTGELERARTSLDELMARWEALEERAAEG